MDIFDPKINNQHTQECIKRLLSLYQKVDGRHSHREEFESLYLLFNLGQTEALMHYFDLSEDIRYMYMYKVIYPSLIKKPPYRAMVFAAVPPDQYLLNFV